MKRLFHILPFLFIFAGACGTYATSIKEVDPTAILPQPLLTRRCQGATMNRSWNIEVSGTLVLTEPNAQRNQFLNMRSRTTYPISGNENDLAFNFRVSPDGKWLAYNREDELAVNSLIVRSADGKDYYVSPQDGLIAYWLNNEELILWHPSGNGFLDYITVFDPFTLSKRVLGNDYPNIIPEDIGWIHWPSLTIYDPSLQYVVYVGISGSDYKPGYHQLMLWNRRNNQPVAEINDFGYTPVYPIWKSDGSGVLFVKALTGMDAPIRQDEWFFLSSDGETKQLTNLKELFESPSIYSASLSPDERFLAFELVTNFTRKAGENIDRRLLVLDTTTLELIDYCLIPEQFARLIWSPDSHYLAFSTSPKSEELQTVVLDVLNGSVFVAAEHLRPEGWMESEK